MGLFTQLVTLPLAPVRGFGWVIQRVTEAAEEEYYDARPVVAALAELEKQLTSGEIDQETFDRREDELLDRLEEIQRFWEGRGP
ncbi:gas vesicle protein GvpG [Streptomyces sp. NPDC015131]|uniref:gas vesicle protein GvpG n=1 Tax=Streptomyces sp. NPDC015131 TaxID=3364941 RepID=UPI0037031AA7